MLSHSLSFWFSALVPHELDLALESEVQKGCRTSVRSGWSPHAGDVGLMLLFISKFLKRALRWEVAGSLSVCLSSAREARPGPPPAPVSPCSQGQLQLLPAAAPLLTSFKQSYGWAQPGPESLCPRNWSSPLGVAVRPWWPPWLPRLSHLLPWSITLLLLPRGTWDQFQPGREHVFWNLLNLLREDE